MFQYIKKSVWFPTSVDFGEAKDIDELVKLCKAGEVERVVIPRTYYGYGASLIDDSNRRSIKRHYKANRFQGHGYSLTMSSYQFLRYSEFREMIEQLQEQYPVFDETDYNELRTETELEFLTEEIAHLLENGEDKLHPLLGAHLSQTKDKVRDVLESGEWDTRIEWWDFVEIDSDGATPYAEKSDIEFLTELVKEKGKRTK